MTPAAGTVRDSSSARFVAPSLTLASSRLFAIVASAVVAVVLAHVVLAPVVLDAGSVALIAALALTAIEEHRGLRRAAHLSAFRDSLWRLTGTVAAAIAAFAAMDRTEGAVFQSTFNTRLEGLALPGGVVAGALLLVVLIAAVWLLPSIAARRMSVGRVLPSAAADTLWFGATATAIGIGHDLRAAATTGVFSEAAGRGSWIALAACFAFAAVRIGIPSAVATEVQSLWIVFLGDRTSRRAMERHAALLAARWQRGPVTLVAAPEAAHVCAGTHLRLAQMQGRLEALFPQRAIHLADWLDTLPPRERWQTLPIRELYVDPALWPQVFETHFDANALAVVVSEDEPARATIDQLRTLLPTGRTDFHLAVRESVKLEGRWPGVEVYPIVGEGAGAIDSWIAANAKPREEAIARARHALIAHVEKDAAFATSLAAALQGRTDDRGRTIRVQTVALGGGRLAAFWQGAQIRFWRDGVRARRLLEAGRGRWYGPVFTVIAKLLTFGVDAEYDLLLIESGALSPADLRRTFDQPLLKFANRVIVAGPQERPPLSLPRSSYAGMVVGDLSGGDARITEIARRYLGVDFDRVVPPAEPLAAEPEQTPRQPRVYLSYPKAYADVAAELNSRLGRTSEVGTGQNPFEAGTQWMRTIEQLRASVDVIVAIIGPETIRSNWALMELEMAAAAEKPILPVVIDRAKLPAFIIAVPSNTDWSGSLLDLTAPDEDERNAAFEQTVANIEKALQRFRAGDPRGPGTVKG